MNYYVQFFVVILVSLSGDFVVILVSLSDFTWHKYKPFYHIYLTPPLGQDMTQGQFF